MGIYQRAETRVGGVTLPHVTGLQVVGRVTQVGAAGRPESTRPEGRLAAASQRRLCAICLCITGCHDRAAENADDILMASLPCQGVTAYLALTASTTVKPGESVLVHGGGRWGRKPGNPDCEAAWGQARSLPPRVATKNVHLHSVLGADVAVDYCKRDWPSVVLEHTAGRGVDIILEVNWRRGIRAELRLSRDVWAPHHFRVDAPDPASPSHRAG